MNSKMTSKSKSRISIRRTETLDETKSNAMPLYSSISLVPNMEYAEDDSLLQLLKAARRQSSKMSDLSDDTSTGKKIKSVDYDKTAKRFPVDREQVLQLILQDAADQLALILGKQSSHKSKLYHYKTPDERFNKPKEYTLETEHPTKTSEQKMLKIQHMIKMKIDEVILFLHNILRDTSDELRTQATFETLEMALKNISRAESDDFTVLNMKADELCAMLFRDIKRIEIQLDRLMESNRALEFGCIKEEDRILFLNMKKLDYMEKWETSRQWINKYIANKQCDDILNYIRFVERNIYKDQEASLQITFFLNEDIEDLEQRRDVYPEKLDKECEMRNRVITQLKDDLEKMQIHKKELAAEIKLRTKKMEDWIIYRTQKEAEDAELARIAEEEELARIAEEERIAAELAAEEELLATFTSKERLIYLKNKKKEEKKAAKAAKKAAKLAKKKERRTA